MKIRTQIFLLLLLLVGAFALGLLGVRHYSHGRLLRLMRDGAFEQNRAFDEFLKNRSASLATFASADYTDWDEMVRAVVNSDTDWARRNLTDITLRGYEANAVWIYRADLSLFHAHNNIPAENLDEIPLPKEVAIPALFGPQLAGAASFFVRAPQGIMEVHGVPLRPAWDAARETAPIGYFFAARLWSNADLKEISLLTGHRVHITPADVASGLTRDERLEGVITFQRDLPGWDGQPLGKLLIRSETPIIREFNRDARRLFYVVIAFALGLFLLLSVELRRLVTRPLKTIVRSLHHKQFGGLQDLEKQRTEFGQLAQMIRTFFEQRENLLKEINERKAAEKALRDSEERLRHSQKMEAIGRLAGGVAHDFNNLLTAIIGYSGILDQQLEPGSPLQQKASLIKKAGEQAAGLTRQLLAFSRKQLLQPKVIDLNALVADMEKLLRRIIGEHIEIHPQPGARAGRILADPNQIEQVLLNLGVNARDAMPGGGELVIRTANVELIGSAATEGVDVPPGHYVLLEVSDNGQGMDEETQSRIFEPFFTTKGPGKGTGLGLATVYGIVRQSNGGIAVESELGRGSTFRLYFPVASGRVETEKPAGAPVEPTLAGETVLVVEDEEVVRDLVCDVLQSQGYDVLSAEGGMEALDLVASRGGRIDLLITDMVMPQMNGYELAQRLVALYPTLGVLYVSGYSEADFEAQGVVREHIRILQKPFTPDALARRVREALEEAAAAKNTPPA